MRDNWHSTDAGALVLAIIDFEHALPGWWWSVCTCSVSADASCAPDIAGPDADLLKMREFDAGFHWDDHEGTLAGSLRKVMEFALSARETFRTASAQQQPEQTPPDVNKPDDKPRTKAE